MTIWASEPDASRPAAASNCRPFSAIGCQWKIEPMPNSMYRPFSSAARRTRAKSSSRKDSNGESSKSTPANPCSAARPKTPTGSKPLWRVL